MSHGMPWPEMIIALAGVVTLFGWPIIWIVAYYLYEGWKSWNETALKRDMVARGYTAQEIVQVVGAKKGSQYANTTDTPPAKPVYGM